jgi:hypothetical protein
MSDHPNKRSDNHWPGLGKFALGIIAILQVVVAAWFSGAIARREQSLYVWDEYFVQLRRFGTADAVFDVALYLLYYAFIVELAYVILSGLLKSDEPVDKVGAWDVRVRIHTVQLGHSSPSLPSESQSSNSSEACQTVGS